MNHLFFSFDQPNYARWLARFNDNLLNVEETHPQLAEEFRNGRFGIKRTTKSFSQIPIDLTSEQTINGDAASQHTDITQSTNSISARQRWAKGHFLRESIVSHLMESLDINKKDDVTSDLKKNRIQKNCDALRGIVEYVDENLNSFSDKINKDSLFNIVTGRSASEKTEEFLLNTETIVNKACNQFIDECAEDPKRFEKTISFLKVLNTKYALLMVKLWWRSSRETYLDSYSVLH